MYAISCLFDADYLCDSDALVVWYNCEWVFDVCNVCECDYLLRVFDPGRLLVVRVGNLNESS